MNKNQTLEVRLVDSLGQPLTIANVIVDVTFFLKGKERFGFRVGATDENGRSVISYDDLEKARLIDLHYQPWDFKTPLDDCDPTIMISIPSASDIEQAIHTAKLYNQGVLPEWARDWTNANNGMIKASRVQTMLSNGLTVVPIPCELTAT